MIIDNSQPGQRPKHVEIFGSLSLRYYGLYELSWVFSFVGNTEPGFNGGYYNNPNGAATMQPNHQQFQPVMTQANPNPYGGNQPFNPMQQQQQSQQNVPFGFQPGQFIQDPMIANVAMQYGQNLVGQGQDYLEKNLEKYMSVSKVKYYFAVDTQYVMKKMRIIFFPFTHTVSSSSLKCYIITKI